MTNAAFPPLVAIATPVYNGARFLSETLESVQSQTYPNIVHCILDNASNDATPEIIDRFRNGRIPLITARNASTLPQVDNWNAALGLVPHDASYFRVLSADDLIDPQCIEKLVALGEQNPCADVITCQELVNVYLPGTDLPSRSYVRGTDLPSRSVFDGRSVIRASLLRDIEFPYVHCLFRSPPNGIPKHFYKTGVYGTRLLCADVDAVMRVLSQSRCAYVHEPLTITRWPGNETLAGAIPNKVYMWELLQLIDRWGPTVFDTNAEYLRCRRRHLRYYYLHFLLWIGQRKFKVLEHHWDLLGSVSARPKVFDYPHALVEWLFLRTMFRLRQAFIRLGFLARGYQID
jgi:glycosyltransferase involved in cell wall biosynthesis